MSYYFESDEAINLAASRAATQMAKGVSNDLVYNILIDLGRDAETAKKIMTKAQTFLRHRIWMSNGLIVVLGAVGFAIGIIGTSFNYYITAPGNHYMVYAGIVLVGAFSMIKGAYKIIAFEIKQFAKVRPSITTPN
jgi:hypothetical protein